MQKSVAIIGSGVSGLVAARLLALDHDVAVFEAGDHLGGHAQTVEFTAYGRSLAADVGFMVFNRRTYPNFCRLLEALGVAARPSDMSFSVQVAGANLEYQGSSLNGLFAQRRNLARPAFLRMLRDILRFNRDASRTSLSRLGPQSLGEFVRERGYGAEFLHHYLLPMTAAIWSAPPQRVEEFPAAFLLRFFRNHGLVQLRDRPQWMTLRGGSRRYVEALAAPLAEQARLNCRVDRVERTADGVVVHTADGDATAFDVAVLAVHAPDALAMLDRPTTLEQDVLGQFHYQASEAVLHTDAGQLPACRRAWASWNYRVEEDASAATVTYDLNRLQGLGTPGPICLTLNPRRRLAANTELARFRFTHPLYSFGAIAAQRRWEELHQDPRVFFCGAYWGNGFHEDGVTSALAVSRRFGRDLDDLRSCTVASTQDDYCTSAVLR